MQPSRHLFILVYVVTLVLCTFTVSGADVGLPSFVTARRLALFILILMTLFIHSQKLSITREVYLLLGGITFVVLYGCVSSAVNSRLTSRGFTELISWCLNGGILYLNALILPHIVGRDRQVFTNTMLRTSCLIVIATGGYILFFSDIQTDYFSVYILRSRMNETLFGGLNRFLNALLFWLVFPVTAALGMLQCSRLLKTLSRISVIGFLLVAAVCGSRQNVVAGIMLICFVALSPYFLARLSISGKLRRSAAIMGFGAISLLVLSTFLVISSSEFISVIQDRVVTRTASSFEEGGGRIPIFRQGLQVISARPLFGVGGDFWHHELNTLGIATHNGYIALAAGWGLPPLIVMLCCVTVCIVGYIGMVRRLFLGRNIAISLLCFQVMFLAWTVNFNDLLRDPTVFLAITICSYWIRTQSLARRHLVVAR